MSKFPFIVIAKLVKFSFKPHRLTLITSDRPAVYHWLWFNFGLTMLSPDDFDNMARTMNTEFMRNMIYTLKRLVH